jgi:hypothetical protein
VVIGDKPILTPPRGPARGADLQPWFVTACDP